MRISITPVLACIAWPAAQAHHSPTAYDQTKELVIHGTIVEVEWKNPHSYLTVETMGPAGTPQLVEIEVVGVSAFPTLGLQRQTLALGARVEVRAAPHRSGAGRTVLGTDITMSDGTIYPLRAIGRSGVRSVAAVAAESIAGKWAPTPEAWIESVRAARAVPQTEAGRAAAGDLKDARASAARCEPHPVPQLMFMTVLHTVEVGADTVVLAVDDGQAASARTVHLDQNRHPEDLEPTRFGHSFGRWEGATLVIDTIGFAPHALGVASGVPGSARKHLVERLSLTEDRRQLRYEIEVEDPGTLTQTFRHTQLWDHRPELEPGEACDPAIALRFLEEEPE